MNTLNILGDSTGAAARDEGVNERPSEVRLLLHGFGFSERHELDRGERYFRTNAKLDETSPEACARVHIAEWFDELLEAEGAEARQLDLVQAQAAFRLVGAQHWGMQALLRRPQQLGVERMESLGRAVAIVLGEAEPQQDAQSA